MDSPCGWLLCESTDLRRGQDTYSEGGTHKEMLCPQSKAKERTRDEGTESQPDELWIHKTDAVIAQNKNEEESTG